MPGTLPAASTEQRPEAPGPQPTPSSRRGAGALWVGAGIFLSRILGLVRERAFAYYFGNSVPAAAFRAALRIPNFLQNLFGEGVLSGSFIPVYAQLLARGEEDEADRVASAVFGLMSLATAALVALGVAFTPLFIEAVAPGFTGEARVLAVLLVRILFPATGLLVLSAWCLGILNSHRRFFLSYAAPALWNAALIATLIGFGRRATEARLAELVAYAAVFGSLLQFGIQLPTALGLMGKFRPSLDVKHPSVRKVLRNFGPVVLGRGVVQVSAFIDMRYASLVSTRALSALGYAQTLYLIPISLFGMAVSAAELPEMSQTQGTTEEIAAKLRQRINIGSGRIAFFVIPSAAAFLLLGDVVAGALLQTGRFRFADTRYTWYLLIGSTVGLLAAALGRLYSSAFYALNDTKTPLYYAVIRVTLTAVLAYLCAVRLPGWLGVPRDLGGVGITATTGMVAWLEFLLLRRKLGQRIGPSGPTGRALLTLWSAAAAAGLIGLGIKMWLAHMLGTPQALASEWHGEWLPAPAFNPQLTALATLLPFGVIYFALTSAAGVPESLAVVRRILRRR